ncbi:MAG: response regulator [Bacteroidales bacterium]|nr:response regulator [Bacteroidales bacterium]
MEIVIIEDEVFAARRLENMIREIDAGIEVIAKLESVRDSIAWFRANRQPDLIFLDIHLDDDLSFTIFREIPVLCSIVFTTATDEIATSAFHLKGIDFLLKPIVQNDLKRMIEKYRNIPKLNHPIDPDIFKDIVNSR